MVNVKCGALECAYNKDNKCTKEEINIVDVEENENIKFKESDFMICKDFDWKT